eukprot:6488945-Prymnesium_polylepis.2
MIALQVHDGVAESTLAVRARESSGECWRGRGGARQAGQGHPLRLACTLVMSTGNYVSRDRCQYQPPSLRPL